MKPQHKAVVVIPTLNEEAHICDVLSAILSDTGATEIWVMDGGSVDGTRHLLHEYETLSSRVRVIENPGRTQAHAMNLAGKMAHKQGFSMLVRVDAHAVYPKNYVSRLTELLRQSEAGSVVVPLIATPTAHDSSWRKASVDLQRSWLGNGGARHRNLGKSGWVCHGHHAAFDLNVFTHLGGYDTRFAACEDVDFDLRLSANGHRIWLAAGLPVKYIPRATPLALLKQMVRNGRARLACARKHGQGLSKRQALPALAIACSGLSLIVAFLASPYLILPLVLYVALVLWMAWTASHFGGLLHWLRISGLAILSHAGFTLGLAIEWLQPKYVTRANP